MKAKIFFGTVFLLLFATGFCIRNIKRNNEDLFITYKVDVKKSDLKFYWKDDKNEIFKSIQNLKTWVEKQNRTLVFAMNGGMYMQDNTPLGLYIENKSQLTPLNTRSGSGNFYLQPNGVFYITTDHVPTICETSNFVNSGNIKYATQSGPLLLINGSINSVFKEGSENLNIRNCVGILPNNQVVFAMSKEQVNFYDFASYFKSLGCKYALYLDGFVSKTYLPEQDWIQTDGNFGVIVGVTEVKAGK
jgi:uncharacterized protein YigE (DUF2233 family)